MLRDKLRAACNVTKQENNNRGIGTVAHHQHIHKKNESLTAHRSILDVGVILAAHALADLGTGARAAVVGARVGCPEHEQKHRRSFYIGAREGVEIVY